MVSAVEVGLELQAWSKRGCRWSIKHGNDGRMQASGESGASVQMDNKQRTGRC